jgi:hypothetical protein
MMTSTPGQTNDPCADKGCLIPPAEFVRLRYFFGQHLNVIDFSDEQAYLIGKQRFHNRLLHGAGVLCGLRADRYVFPQTANADPNAKTTLLRVQRGAALDWCGREIVVGWDQCIDVAAWWLRHSQPSGGGTQPTSVPLWVGLCYRDCPSDPAPAPRDPCGCDTGGCEYARIREGFELKLLTADQEKVAAAANQIKLDGEVISEEQLAITSQTAYAEAAAKLAGLDCPAPSGDPCLLLASFGAKLGTIGSGSTGVVDITAPNNAIPTRATLLPASILQLGVLRVLAGLGDAELLGFGPTFSTIDFEGTSATAGSLNIHIELSDGGPLASPNGTNASLSVTVAQFKASDGTWTPVNPDSPPTLQTSGSPPQTVLTWISSNLGENQYRMLVENDPKAPVVDTKLRPITPLLWARHLRLVKDSSSGNLTLAASLNS